MQGEFKGDFTRDTFHRAKHFSRVLMQQGRVQLDADWNEQTSILLHYLRTLAADLIGPHGGPAAPNADAGEGFIIQATSSPSNDFTIGIGRYYVEGVLCENGPLHTDGSAPTYFSQPDYSRDKEKDALTDGPWLVYLDVWERHIVCNQDDDIREVALGWPDTATRAKVVWQVKTTGAQPDSPIQLTDFQTDDSAWSQYVAKNLQGDNRGLLKAQVQPQQTSTDPCTISPQSKYRGPENQLYRVEIHSPNTSNSDTNTPATFKWSRENGSVIFPILDFPSSSSQIVLTLANVGRDERSGLHEGNWVEIVDDDSILQNQPGDLLKVLKIDRTSMTVTLDGIASGAIGGDPTKHPLLRRWEGTNKISESNGSNDADWTLLEDGVQIQFRPPTDDKTQNQYRTGDYWLIPARVATGDVEWPKVRGPQGNLVPDALPPHGVEHHYAPLAVITVNSGTVASDVTDLRRMFKAQVMPSS